MYSACFAVSFVSRRRIPDRVNAPIGEEPLAFQPRVVRTGSLEDSVMPGQFDSRVTPPDLMKTVQCPIVIQAASEKEKALAGKHDIERRWEGLPEVDSLSVGAIVLSRSENP
jgi:hypothetical protein